MQRKIQSKVSLVTAPLDTRLQKSNFQVDNEKHFNKLQLNAETDIVEIFGVVSFVCFLVLPQVYLSRDSFRLEQDLDSF